jgi:hypothetical protein
VQFVKKNNWLSGQPKAIEKIESCTNPNPIYPGVSTLRFILILLIVCNHLGFGQVADGGFEKMGLKIWFEFTSPILAMLSGWLFFKNINDDKYFSKTKKRFFTILIPYILWSAIYIFIHFIVKKTYAYLTNSTVWISPTPTWSWNYFLDAFWRAPIVGNFWYLKNLLLIIPFNWIFIKMLKRHLVFELFYVTLLCCLFLNINLWFSERFIQYYLIGCYLGFNNFSLNGIFLKNMSVTTGLLLLGATLEILAKSSKYSHLLKIPVIFLIVMLSLGSLKKFSDSKVMQSLMRWEKDSFFIFAAHTIIISIVGKSLVLLLPKFIFQNPAILSAMLGIQFILTILLCVSLSRFTKLISCGLWSLLMGGRASS